MWYTEAVSRDELINLREDCRLTERTACSREAADGNGPINTGAVGGRRARYCTTQRGALGIGESSEEARAKRVVVDDWSLSARLRSDKRGGGKKHSNGGNHC
jgi:hypothetical protein